MINDNKNRTIITSTGTYGRDAVKTRFIEIGDSIFDIINEYIPSNYQEGDIVAISSKVVSLCQKRIVYKRDMKLSLTAKVLSKFASTSTAGIGVNSVWKMQYAIDFCGHAKVIYAAICSAFGKLFGKRGIFYDIVGVEISGLDGFYDKSFKVYGDYGIQIPVNCNRFCNEIYDKTGIVSFISDANDFTRTIFGKCDRISLTDNQLCEIISDNPAGQSDQCTPFVIIRRETTD